MFKKVMIGLIAGLIAGLFSAGGGMIVVPSLIHIFKMEDAEARATSVFVILPMVIVSGLFFWGNNFIDWTLGAKVAVRRDYPEGLLDRNY